MRIQLVILLSALCIDRSNNLNATAQTNDYDEQLFEEYQCANVNIRLSEHRTLLHLAAIKGDIQAVHSLIDRKVPVRAEDALGREALDYAVQNGHFEIARILFQHNAIPNNKDADGKPAFHLVADLDEIDALNMAKLFVQNIKHVDILCDITDKFGNTLLHIAIKKGYLSLVEFLVEKGAKLNAKNINDDTPLRLAFALQPNRSDIASFLTQKSADLNFLEACDKGNLNLIQYLHETHAVDVNAKDNYNQNGLFKAIVGNGDLEVVKYLVNIGVNINEKTTDYWTPVIKAVQYDKFDIVKYLIENGADFKIVVTANDTVLGTALSQYNSNFEMVKYLLHVGLNDKINHKDIHGWSPLFYSIYYTIGNLKLTKYLIQSGAKTDTLLNGKTAITLAKERHESPDVRQYLEQLPNDTTLQSQIDTNSLFFAAAQNNLKLVEQYLNKNISVNVEDEHDDQTPLYKAIYYNGQLNMIKFLHSKGADVKQFDPIKLENLVYLSIFKRKFEVAKYLIENGADCETPGVSGNTPLHGAIEMANDELVKLLLHKVGYNNRINANGKSPLKLLFKTRNEKMIRYLIFEYKDSEGRSILHQLACQELNNDILTTIHFVLERGAHVNAQDNAKNTPLHLAVVNGNLHTVVLLSEQICVNIAAKNVNGQTALDLAQNNKDYSIKNYLSGLMKTQTVHQA